MPRAEPGRPASGVARGALVARAVAGLVCAALLAPAAHAQSPEARPGRFHVGPLWLTPRIVLHNAGVDDNVFNDDGTGVSDRQAVLTPSLVALLPVGRHLRVIGTGSLGLNYFERETSARSTDTTGTGRAELDLGPFTLFGSAGGGRHKQRFSVEIDQRLDRRSSTYGGGVAFRPSRRLTLTGEVTRQTNRYEEGVQVRGDDVQSALDRRVTVRSGEASYALTPRTSLVFSADVLDERFTAQAGGPDEVRSYRYMGGFRFTTGALLSGGVRVGVRDYPERDDQAAPGYNGLSLAVDTALPVGQRARLALLATRDVTYAVGRGAGRDGPQRNSFVASTYGGTFTTELPASLLARVSLTFQRADYVLPDLSGGAPLDRLDEVRSIGFALLRAFGRSFRVGGTVERARRTSNLSGFGYERTSYGITAEYSP